jgi:hypothetical protein
VLSYANEKGEHFHVVEVYAYYSVENPTESDPGTVLRFVEAEV